MHLEFDTGSLPWHITAVHARAVCAKRGIVYQTLNTRRPDTNAGQRPSPLAAEVGLADVVVLEEVGASAGLLDGADL